MCINERHVDLKMLGNVKVKYTSNDKSIKQIVVGYSYIWLLNDEGRLVCKNYNGKDLSTLEIPDDFTKDIIL